MRERPSLSRLHAMTTSNLPWLKATLHHVTDGLGERISVQKTSMVGMQGLPVMQSQR